MNEAELEKKVEEKIKRLEGSSPIEALAAFLTVRPVGLKNKNLIRQDLETLQNIVGKLMEKDYEALLQKLN